MVCNPEYAAPCGLYCGMCAILIAHREGNTKLKEKLVALYQGGTTGKGVLPNAASLTVDDIRCDGCLSDDRFMHCQQCEIRSCTAERGYQGCHQCAEFPCGHIEGFSMAVGKKVILRAVPYRRQVGTERWMQDEEIRYQCPGCGSRAFRGAMRCNQCKAPLDLD